MTQTLVPQDAQATDRRSRRRQTRSTPDSRPVRPPRPPHRVPGARPARPPLSALQMSLRMACSLAAFLLVGMTVYLVGFGPVSHLISQDRLNAELRQQLRAGTAPVSEGDFEGVLLRDGAPVAQLRIPQIGLDETIVEGTTAGVLAAGPGHRRDTVLPGQLGTSVLMGRAAAFGGPFGKLQELQPGMQFTVVTGQGQQTFQVIGVRYAGDPSPAPLHAGESRMVLETARGAAFMPSGVLRVDAELVSAAQAPGQRQTSRAALPASAKELASDLSHVWALVFALQALVLVEAGAVWTFRHIGPRQAWIVFLPLGLLTALAAADQVTRLLPNLM